MQSDSTDIQARRPGRPREFDMNEALEKAAHVFCERGFHAASITDLADGMGLTAGSLYKAFQDKRAIFISALQHSSERHGRAQAQAIAGANTGKEKLRSLVAFYAGISCGASGRQGCLIVSTAIDMATYDEEIVGWVTHSFRQREKLMGELLRQGQADGSVPQALDVKATAHFMLCVLQGLRVVGKSSPSKAETMAVVDVAMKALD